MSPAQLASSFTVRGDRYELNRPVVVTVPHIAGFTLRVEIPEGYTFDGASIPRLCWSFLGVTPFHPSVIIAACVHDWMCENASYYRDRVIGDSLFLWLLEESGVPYLRRAIMYGAVRFYARTFWSWQTYKQTGQL